MRFTAQIDVGPENSLFISGEEEELGNRRKALALKKKDNRTDIWECELDPTLTATGFKFLVAPTSVISVKDKFVTITDSFAWELREKKRYLYSSIYLTYNDIQFAQKPESHFMKEMFGELKQAISDHSQQICEISDFKYDPTGISCKAKLPSGEQLNLQYPVAIFRKKDELIDGLNFNTTVLQLLPLLKKYGIEFGGMDCTKDVWRLKFITNENFIHPPFSNYYDKNTCEFNVVKFKKDFDLELKSATNGFFDQKSAADPTIIQSPFADLKSRFVHSMS